MSRLADCCALAFLVVTLLLAAIAWVLSGQAARALAALVIATVEWSARPRGQVIPAGLAELCEQVQVALPDSLRDIMKAAIRAEVGFENAPLDPFGSADHRAGRHHTHVSDQGVKPYHVGDVFRLMSQRVSIESRGLINEIAVERLQLLPFFLAYCIVKLCSLREPSGAQRGHTADDSTREGGKCRAGFKAASATQVKSGWN